MNDGPAAKELVFAPVRPGAEAWLIALFGPQGCGKTFSALRLARGLVGPQGKIGVADTENGRARFYARDFDFLHAEIRDPFTPMKYVAVAENAKKAGCGALIIDSMSHEWAGIGGVLDWHETELSRMAGTDYEKRERMTYAAWIKPKAAHKAMMNRLLQLNMPVIFCLRAEKKISMEKNDKGKIVPVDAGWQPVCAKDFLFDMTVSFLLQPEARGVPVPHKLNERHEGLFDLGAVLDEAAGERIGRHARGENVEPVAQTPRQAAPPARQQQRQAPRQTPPDAGPASPQAAAREANDARVEAGATELVLRFQTTKNRREHFRITENKAVRTQLEWLREQRPQLHEKVGTAMRESFRRTEGTEGDGPPDEEPAAAA